MKKLIALVLALTLCLGAASALAADYVIGTDNPFVPFEWIDADGNLVGIDIELMEAIAADQGFTVEWQPVGWDSAIAGCQAGQFDAMIAGASIKQERIDNGWHFSDGYYNAGQSMAVAADSAIASLDDMAGKMAVAKIGTESAAYADELSATYGFTVTKVEDDATMYQYVLGGQADAVFNDTPILNANITNGVALKVVEGTANAGADYGFAIFTAPGEDLSDAQQALMDKFNAGLANVKANGTYDAILAKYLN
ncbi:MAG: transporter substrate-binding domain-containing protein [Clostridia bacterium]|nr:transporter substrate-binding domain-containing protein [Clostridia bacterium]